MTKEEMLSKVTFEVHKLRQELINSGLTVFPIKEVKLSTRCTKRFGQCTYHRRYGKIVSVTITISDICFHNTENCLRDTILHELCHAMPNGQNHRAGFHNNARMVMRLYDNCHIDRCVSREESNLKNEYIKSIGRGRENKYKLTCKGCGKVYYYKRETKLVRILKNGKQAYTYYCGKCKCREFILENL